MFKIKKKPKFYDVAEILQRQAQYNIIFGERSNGKTYSALMYALKRYFNHGEEFAYIRRYDEEIKGKNINNLFSGHVKNGVVEELSNGKFSSIKSYSGAFYLSYFDEKTGKELRSDVKIGNSFSLTGMEHTKSTSFPKITTIIYDEFITRGYYLNDEFVTFLNLISTIVRLRDNVKIFMLGNTVNKFCPYFKEMGLKNIENMKQGEIDVYNYGDSGLKVAVEYSTSPMKNKPSNVYFAFNNPKLNMISKGVWEIALYPHKPIDFDKNDILLIYFLEFEEHILQCEIVLKEQNLFTYIHEKTTPIKNPKTDIIYSPIERPGFNYRRKITTPQDQIGLKIYNFFKIEKVFYQNNEVGEIVRNYLNWCISDKRN